MNIPLLSRLLAKEPRFLPHWRWATEEETFDVWVPAPEHGAGAERGIAAWRMKQGTEQPAEEIEWVHVMPRNVWMPARRDLDPVRIVVFDGFQVQMASVPAGGKNLGQIEAA